MKKDIAKLLGKLPSKSKLGVPYAKFSGKPTPQNYKRYLASRREARENFKIARQLGDWNSKQRNSSHKVNLHPQNKRERAFARKMLAEMKRAVRMDIVSKERAERESSRAREREERAIKRAVEAKRTAERASLKAEQKEARRAAQEAMRQAKREAKIEREMANNAREEALAQRRAERKERAAQRDFEKADWSGTRAYRRELKNLIADAQSRLKNASGAEHENLTALVRELRAEAKTANENKSRELERSYEQKARAKAALERAAETAEARLRLAQRQRVLAEFKLQAEHEAGGAETRKVRDKLLAEKRRNETPAQMRKRLKREQAIKDERRRLADIIANGTPEEAAEAARDLRDSYGELQEEQGAGLQSDTKPAKPAKFDAYGERVDNLEGMRLDAEYYNEFILALKEEAVDLQFFINWVNDTSNPVAFVQYLYLKGFSIPDFYLLIKELIEAGVDNDMIADIVREEMNKKLQEIKDNDAGFYSREFEEKISGGL